jgi:hypothetical protein
LHQLQQTPTFVADFIGFFALGSKKSNKIHYLCIGKGTMPLLMRHADRPTEGNHAWGKTYLTKA